MLDRNPIKAPKAGLIDFWTLFLCKYSHINAHANGHKINPIGQINIHVIIHMRHHQFHHLDHQNFLVHNIGR
jgi:hypothetical protein